MFSCGLACCEVIPMALIVVFCLLMMTIYAVYELMIWLCIWGCPVLRASLKCYHVS
jgi:hypothetical protein